MSASVIAAVRFPVAFAFGLLITSSLFLALWSVTAGTYVYIELEATPVKLDTVRPDSSSPSRRLPPPKPVLEDTRVITDIRVIEGVKEVIRKPVFYLPQVTEVTTPPVITMAQGMDRDAVPSVRVQPDYPQGAATRGTEGWVIVQFNISATGTVTDAVVVDSEPANTFENAALNAVARWRYNPKVEDGVAVERRGLQTIIRFDLDGEQEGE